jgi:hypothetical protein
VSGRSLVGEWATRGLEPRGCCRDGCACIQLNKVEITGKMGAKFSGFLALFDTVVALNSTLN